MKNLFRAFVIVFLLISCQSKEYGGLNFIIDDTQDISFAGKSRLVYRVLLDVKTLPVTEEIKSTAVYIWEDGNNLWDELTVFLYLPEMDTKLNAYAVAEFNQKGLVRYQVNPNSLIGTKWEQKVKKEGVPELTLSETKEYSIIITALAKENKKLEIAVETNFPNGTNLLLTVGRPHYLKGIDDEYSGEIHIQDYAVTNGKIISIVQINDANWYNEHQRLVKLMPDDLMPIARISDNISIDVLFSPKRDQKANILSIVGQNGELIKGVGTEKFGTLTTFRASKQIPFPFSN